MKRIAVLLLAAGLLPACMLVAPPNVTGPKVVGPNGSPIDMAGAMQMAQNAKTAMTMQQAERIALTYYYEMGTYEEFTPEAATQYEPSITWNSSPTAVEGEVSIRNLTATTVVLASKNPSGEVWCMGDDRRQDVTTHGMVDAQTVTACTGDTGWPEF